MLLTARAGKLKTHELREKDKAELEGLLTEHRKQLASLRVEQISGGNQTKLSKIREVRKAIARIETVIHQETLHQVRKKYAGKKARAHRPRDLRQKKVSSHVRPPARPPASPSSSSTDARHPPRHEAV